MYGHNPARISIAFKQYESDYIYMIYSGDRIMMISLVG